MIEALPLFAGMGPPELAIILVIAVLLFGANKIPKLARSTGQAMGEFQKGREEVEEELQEIREGPGEVTTESQDEVSSETESTETERSETESASSERSSET